MIILDKQATRVIAQVLSAARDSLKDGEHDGRCVWMEHAGEEIGPCRVHLEMAARRRKRLADAVAAWDALNE